MRGLAFSFVGSAAILASAGLALALAASAPVKMATLAMPTVSSPATPEASVAAFPELPGPGGQRDEHPDDENAGWLRPDGVRRGAECRAPCLFCRCRIGRILTVAIGDRQLGAASPSTSSPPARCDSSRSRPPCRARRRGRDLVASLAFAARRPHRPGREQPGLPDVGQPLRAPRPVAAGLARPHRRLAERPTASRDGARAGAPSSPATASKSREAPLSSRHVHARLRPLALRYLVRAAILLGGDRGAARLSHG